MEQWEDALRVREHALSILHERRTVPMLERSVLADIEMGATARARLLLADGRGV
jgi:hypothetical protein